MRLIDADKIKETDFYDCVNTEECMAVINEQPTAYDVEAVLAELNNLAMWREVLIYPLDYRERTILNKVEEIVKRGGRNENIHSDRI